MAPGVDVLCELVRPVAFAALHYLAARTEPRAGTSLPSHDGFPPWITSFPLLAVRIRSCGTGCSVCCPSSMMRPICLSKQNSICRGRLSQSSSFVIENGRISIRTARWVGVCKYNSVLTTPSNS